MSLSANIKFPQIVNQIQLDNGSVNGGMLSQYRDAGGYFTGINYSFADVKHVDLSDLTFEHVSDNPYYQTLYTMPNGIEFKLKIVTYGLISPATFQAYVVAMYGGNEIVLQGGAADTFAGNDSSGNGDTSWLLLKEYGMTVAFLTSYPAVDYVEGVTEPNRFSIMCGMATRGTHDSITFINTNAISVSSGQIVRFEDLSTMGDYTIYSSFHYGYNITNLDQWITSFRSYGTDTQDPTSIGDQLPTGSSEADTSTTGGGGGNYDQGSDPIDFPDLPTGGALSSGAIKGYLIDSNNLTLMMNTLWGLDVTTQFKKLFSEPLQALISLTAIPYVPSSIAANSSEVKLATIETGGYGYLINNQYDMIDCGSLTLREYWGSALDYSPYTKVEIYLPAIGIRPLQIEDVQQSKIQVKYMVDCLTGDCVAFIKCGKSVLYTFTGNIASKIPVSAQSSDQLKHLINAVGGAVGTAAGGGGLAAGVSVSSALNVVLSKKQLQRSGDVAGTSAIMGDLIPYLIIHRPMQSLANNFKSFKGYPSNITKVLGTCSGYTEVEYIHLSGIDGATDTELEEIKNLLSEGVII